MAPPKIGDILERCELFSGLTKKEIEKIASLASVETYKAGETILNQGDFGENLYIIEEGHVFIERAVDMGSRKGNAVISLLGKGRVLGCWSTLIGEPHNLMSSAVCRKPTKVVVISGQALREMMMSNSRLGLRIMERLCFMLRDRIRGLYGAMENV